MSLGSIIRNARVELGMSRAELAKAVGRKERTVVAWEHGQNGCRLAEIVSLSATLGIPVTDLVAAHRRTTTAATEGTDSRNGPTVLEGLASTSIGVSSAAQDVSGRAEERVSNMVASGDPLNVAPPHRHTQPSERDE